MSLVLEDFRWDQKRTDDAEVAWTRLGEHLRLTSTRPEKQYGSGPDNLWASGDRHAVDRQSAGDPARRPAGGRG
jgi:hypothetical protein